MGGILVTTIAQRTLGILSFMMKAERDENCEAQ